ncbi:MAG: Lrp/AsnC ligand binding domain-containing protein [Candidatus Woesearchaeota archaeon]|jgi:DNA-binding Lrp family transcriptional regulator|nr:Lrp/AsnC ligand binding domain-containing protein [Candidatus Woesearchaeota archaeon]MDP7457811.1 Lrp/AsnC ligand binding domain-containing protein [Candidatus Woesearchaeota archaeon]
MKDISPKLVELFKQGYCTPQIARVAKKLKEPSTTIHYNIKKLEKEDKVKAYKAVFNYKNIGEGHCAYLLVNINASKYGQPEQVATEIAKSSHVESVDIITGDYEMILKLRVKDIDEYYAWTKQAIQKYGFSKVISLTSLKQVKTEFVTL